MKKVFALIAATAVVMGLTSCDDSVLSASSAKKALKKEAFFSKDYAVKTFETGFYEVDTDKLNDLAKLQAAGVITFTTETVKYRMRRSHYDFWKGYTYYYIDGESIFATVDFTDEGRKYVVDEPVTMREDVYKDLKANINYEERVPDYMSAVYTGQIAGATVEDVEVTVDSIVADSVAVAEDATVIEESSPIPVNDDPEAAYRAALERVAIVGNNVRLGQYAIEKVKEVRCTPEQAKNGDGSCVAIITFKDKTPFGFVLGAPLEGYLTSGKVQFKYYNDIGWVVSDFDK